MCSANVVFSAVKYCCSILRYHKTFIRTFTTAVGDGDSTIFNEFPLAATVVVVVRIHEPFRQTVLFFSSITKVPAVANAPRKYCCCYFLNCFYCYGISVGPS